MATMPSPRTWADADALSTTNLNTGIKDVLAFLLKPPIAELRQTTLQTVATATATAVTLGAEDVDTDVDGTGAHSTSSNTSRYTARYPGWYQCSGGVAFAANATGRRAAFWAVNGTLVSGGNAELPATAANPSGVPSRTKQIYLNAGDYVELMAYQESGGNLNTNVGSGDVQSHMSVRWVSN